MEQNRGSICKSMYLRLSDFWQRCQIALEKRHCSQMVPGELGICRRKSETWSLPVITLHKNKFQVDQRLQEESQRTLQAFLFNYCSSLEVSVQMCIIVAFSHLCVMMFYWFSLFLSLALLCHPLHPFLLLLHTHFFSFSPPPLGHPIKISSSSMNYFQWVLYQETGDPNTSRPNCLLST